MGESTNSMTREEWLAMAYDPNPPTLSPETRHLLETYSKIAPDQVLPHVTHIREKAFAIFPYPCIGRWRFLHLALGQHPLYAEILARMRTGEQRLLDLGCAFAQDIRRLVADGVDGKHCVGTDLRLDFVQLGYELFRDEASLGASFVQGDIFDEEGSLKELEGSLDILNASSFFHLFGWEQQKAVARRCLRLLKPGAGGLVVGRQVGHREAAEYPNRSGEGTRFGHDIDSWRRLWMEVGEETGVRFEVVADLSDDVGFMPGPKSGQQEGTRMMIYSVRKTD